MSRSLAVGWALLLVGVAVCAPLAEGMVGRYSGNDVVIRPWMVTMGSAVALAHLVALAAVAFGARARRLAASLFGVAAALVLGQLAAPHLLGSGPHAHGGAGLAVMTALVFLPLVVRGAGWVALAWPAQRAVAALAVVEVGITLWWWVQTPVAVVPRLHAAVGWSPALVPFVAGGVLFMIRSNTSQKAT